MGGELIFGGAYVLSGICVSKLIGRAYSWIACKQALLFGRAKRTARERASERRSGPSLARSREASFACPNRRACSQANSWKEIYRFSFVLLCIGGHVPSTSPRGLIFGGAIFAIRVWEAYIWRGLGRF